MDAVDGLLCRSSRHPVESAPSSCSIGALPFSILILLGLRGRLEIALLDPQIRVFAAYVLLFILAVTIYLRRVAGTWASSTH